VATAKHPTYDGHKVLVVQQVDEKGERVGSSFVAVDVVQAGVGDLVLVMSEGNGVRQIPTADPAIRSLIVGIVDAVDVPAGGAPAALPQRGAARGAQRR